MYEAQGHQFDEDDLLQESLTDRWLAIMQKANIEMLATGFANQLKRKRFRPFPRTIDMEAMREGVRWAIENILFVIDVFDFANKHNLSVYAEVDIGRYDVDCGAGENNLVRRFEKRFKGVQFPPYWKKYTLQRLFSPELGETEPFRVKFGPRKGLTAPESEWRYELYLFDGDDHFNVRRLVKTQLLKESLRNLPQVERDGLSYIIHAHHITFSLPHHRKGFGLEICFYLGMGDPVPAYDAAIDVGCRIAEITKLKLFDAQIKQYLDHRTLQEARRKFLECARTARAKMDPPTKYIPHYHGKQWSQ
jgi:hypothetical protein